MWKSCSKCGRLHKYGAACPSPGPVVRRGLTPDQKLRSTSKWQTKRNEIKDASNWLCAICLEQGVYTYNDIEVHHITKLKDWHEGLLDNYNLICLCKRHHELADEGKIDAEHLRELARSREEAR